MHIYRHVHLHAVCMMLCSHYTCSVVLSFGKHMGPFSHPPPSDFAGLFEAAVMDNKEVKLHSFVHLGTTEDLSVSGPSVLANYQGFVPAPIDTGGKVLPDPLLSIRDKLAHNLHEVWAKDKIEAGYRYSQVKEKVETMVIVYMYSGINRPTCSMIAF